MGKKKKNKKKKKADVIISNVFADLCKRLSNITDTEVYAGSLEVCDCEDQQVCDVCQNFDPDNPPKDKVWEEEINEGHYMELMDRIHIIQCTIEEHLSDHPAMTPEMRDELSTAQNYLGNVYQWAGQMYNYFDLE